MWALLLRSTLERKKRRQQSYWSCLCLVALAVLEGDLVYYSLFSWPPWTFFIEVLLMKYKVKHHYSVFNMRCFGLLWYIPSHAPFLSLMLRRNIKAVPRGQRQQPSLCPCVLHSPRYERRWFSLVIHSNIIKLLVDFSGFNQHGNSSPWEDKSLSRAVTPFTMPAD